MTIIIVANHVTYLIWFSQPEPAKVKVSHSPVAVTSGAVGVGGSLCDIYERQSHLSPFDALSFCSSADIAVTGAIPLKAVIFSITSGVPVHPAFHYHPPIVLI